MSTSFNMDINIDPDHPRDATPPFVDLSEHLRNPPDLPLTDSLPRTHPGPYVGVLWYGTMRCTGAQFRFGRSGDGGAGREVVSDGGGCDGSK